MIYWKKKLCFSLLQNLSTRIADKDSFFVVSHLTLTSISQVSVSPWREEEVQFWWSQQCQVPSARHTTTPPLYMGVCGPLSFMMPCSWVPYEGDMQCKMWRKQVLLWSEIWVVFMKGVWCVRCFRCEVISIIYLLLELVSLWISRHIKRLIL